MWLTVNFPDLCRCVYTYYVYPPSGPCLPPSHHAIACIMQGHGVRWSSKQPACSPWSGECVCFQQVSCLRQLLWNQLPSSLMKKQGGFSQQSCVTKPMLKLLHPYGVGCPMLDSRTNSELVSRVSCTNFKIYMKYIFAVIRETTGAEDHVRLKSPTLSL